MSKNLSARVVPEDLKIPHKSDYRRGWMLRNDRTKSVTISTAQLAYLLVALRHTGADLVRDLLGDQTCEAVLDKHSAEPNND